MPPKKTLACHQKKHWLATKIYRHLPPKTDLCKLVGGVPMTHGVIYEQVQVVKVCYIYQATLTDCECSITAQSASPTKLNEYLRITGGPSPSTHPSRKH